MRRLVDKIRAAVDDERFVASWHADERCEERGVTVWRLVAGLADAKLVRERPRSKPYPSVVVRQFLPDGSEVEVIWSWMAESQRAKLVTVYFRDGNKMPERREKRKRWVQRGQYAVEVEVEVIYPQDDPSEPCLEPAAIRWLDEIARRAEQGDVEYLQRVGRVFQAVTP